MSVIGYDFSVNMFNIVSYAILNFNDKHAIYMHMLSHGYVGLVGARSVFLFVLMPLLFGEIKY